MLCRGIRLGQSMAAYLKFGPELLRLTTEVGHDLAGFPKNLPENTESRSEFLSKISSRVDEVLKTGFSVQCRNAEPWLLQGRRGMVDRADKAGEGEGNSAGKSDSWLARLKGMFPLGGGGGKAVDESEELTMEQFADQLKGARKFGSLTEFGRGLPRGGEALATRSLSRQEAIIRAMRPEERADLKKFTLDARARVAAECGCTAVDVSNVVSKYEWFRDAAKKLRTMQKEGKPMPKTMDDVEKMMGKPWSPSASRGLTGAETPSRNSRCPCGSGKNYKRCCGSSASR